MTDYSTDTTISRDQMASMLSDNHEQFIYVLTEALTDIAADDVIEFGQISDTADATLAVHNLRLIANAIENGDLR